MPPPSRLERLYQAALRLREIQNEAAAIYRNFPDLDRRPRVIRTPVRMKAIADRTITTWPAKLH
jgi:hypothetical protein